MLYASIGMPPMHLSSKCKSHTFYTAKTDIVRTFVLIQSFGLSWVIARALLAKMNTFRIWNERKQLGLNVPRIQIMVQVCFYWPSAAKSRVWFSVRSEQQKVNRLHLNEWRAARSSFRRISNESTFHWKSLARIQMHSLEHGFASICMSASICVRIHRIIVYGLQMERAISQWYHGDGKIGLNFCIAFVIQLNCKTVKYQTKERRNNKHQLISGGGTQSTDPFACDRIASHPIGSPVLSAPAAAAECIGCQFSHRQF